MSADDILAEMRAQISGQVTAKKAASIKLTPVKGEGALPEGGSIVGPGKPSEWTKAYPVPNAGGVILDDPDLIRGRLDAIDRELVALTASAARLRELWTVPELGDRARFETYLTAGENVDLVPRKDPVPRVTEQAPDAEQAKFAAYFAVKLAAAQAEVFKAADADGWVCPNHGSYVLRRNSKGTEFRACPEAGCHNWEKP